MFALFARGLYRTTANKHEHILIDVFVVRVRTCQCLFLPLAQALFPRERAGVCKSGQGWGNLGCWPIQVLTQLIRDSGMRH